ncbi:G-protein alpha subunit [Roridomyces roridus]|uniref:G-protein alpha subunit n=1 Tax=Roridomyces roridus TaxID=1738132 RepID=A0AAD7FDW0_9AGAR|nr:G-protein alpha subunit [Roridomyces roridus]KAJ7614471.1 G-protein alpha subunit [Roridomyces roridus]
MVARTHHSQLSDPFSAVLQPPANETAAERQVRVEAEQEQKRVSDQIDDDLRKERIDRKKRAKREVKVLLLGQSESGKSTVLKNFRLKYALTQWKAELRSWRAVIQLNLVQNVLTILDVIQEQFAQAEAPPAPSRRSSFTPPRYGRMSIDSTVSELVQPQGTSHIQLSQKHRVLHLRLSPLREVEEDLRRRLGAEDPDPEFTFANGDDGAANGVLGEHRRRGTTRDFGVRGWIGALGLPTPGGARKSLTADEGVDGVTEILASLSDEIISLWEDGDVRELLGARGIRLEDRPGFFLSDTARITNRNYVPSDNDVVRARLRTMGVQEWRIMLENSDSFGSEWVIYDVGGSRSMRHAWLPYFDAVNAIIFLAPISCFDERLDEDSSVNRLEDTLLLWRTIVSSKLLAKTTLIVFLNKCDLLKRKLQSGVQVNKYMISFGNRENEVGVVVKYLKDKFKDILRTEAPEPRTTYLYPTSVTDTKATAVTLNIVRDGIIREHLKHADLV